MQLPCFPTHGMQHCPFLPSISCFLSQPSFRLCFVPCLQAALSLPSPLTRSRSPPLPPLSRTPPGPPPSEPSPRLPATVQTPARLTGSWKIPLPPLTQLLTWQQALPTQQWGRCALLACGWECSAAVDLRAWGAGTAVAGSAVVTAWGSSRQRRGLPRCTWREMRERTQAARRSARVSAGSFSSAFYHLHGRLEVSTRKCCVSLSSAPGVVPVSCARNGPRNRPTCLEILCCQEAEVSAATICSSSHLNLRQEWSLSADDS